MPSPPRPPKPKPKPKPWSLGTQLRPAFTAPRFRPLWLALLVVMVLGVSWLAFSRSTGEAALPHGDKINHVIAFLALAVAARCGTAPGLRNTAAVVLALLIYGAFIEVVQTQIPGREGEWADLAADTAGIALGVWLATALRARAQVVQEKF